MSGAIQHQVLKKLPSTSSELGVTALWLMNKIFSFPQDLFSCEVEAFKQGWQDGSGGKSEDIHSVPRTHRVDCCGS